MASRSLKRRIFPYTLTIPAGTAPSSPSAGPLDVPNTVLRTLQLTIPTGHVGLTGIAFSLAGQQLLPWPGTADWIIAEGESFTYDLNLEVDGSIDFAAYNLGLYDHSFYVRLTLDDLVLPGEATSSTPAVLAL